MIFLIATPSMDGGIRNDEVTETPFDSVGYIESMVGSREGLISGYQKYQKH